MITRKEEKMHVLPPDHYGLVSSFAKGLSDQGMALSILEGIRPGVVVVNDPSAPTVLFMAASESAFAWTYLAGDPSERGFLKALGTWVFDEKGLGEDVVFTFLTTDMPTWEEALPAFLGPRTVISDERLHYEADVLPPRAWRDRVPEGYQIVDVDRALLDSEVEMHATVSEWLTNNFRSTDGFLKHGVGAAAVHQGKVVGWILADSFVGGLSDIGGEVVEEHRRKGLAFAATCRTVELALDKGATRVGWHCHAINLPSIKTAEAAGFERKQSYTVYPVQFDPAKHGKLVEIIAGEYVERGDAAIAAAEYAKADESLTLALQLRPEASADVFHSAARAAAGNGRADQAFDWLTRAIESGWSAFDETQTRTEFIVLHQDARWADLLKRMEGTA